MSDVSPQVYNLTYWLLAVITFLWVLRTVANLKHIETLHRAIKRTRVVLLHEVQAISQRLSREAVISVLKKRQNILKFDVAVMTPAFHLDKEISSHSNIDNNKIIIMKMTIDNQSTACRIDVFVGVKRQLMNQFYLDYPIFKKQQEKPPPQSQPLHRASAAVLTSGIMKQVQPSISQSSADPLEDPIIIKRHACLDHVTIPSVPIRSKEIIEIHINKVALDAAIADLSLLPIVVVLSNNDTRENRRNNSNHNSFHNDTARNSLSTTKPRHQQIELTQLKPCSNRNINIAPPAQPIQDGVFSYPIDTQLMEISVFTMKSNDPLPLSSHIINHNDSRSPSLYDLPDIWHLESQLLFDPHSNLCVLIEDIYGLSPPPQLESDCIICLSNPMLVILLPCRHLCVCLDCFGAFQQQKCPVCRCPVNDYLVRTNTIRQ